MKKVIGLATLALLAVTLLCVPAKVFAYPVFFGDYNGLFFNNAEVLLDKDGSGSVSIGDTFWGTVQLQQIKAPTDPSGTGGGTIWFPGGGFGTVEVTGYFATDVTGILLPPFGADPGNPTIVLGAPAIDPNGILAGGEVLRLFEDTAVDYNDSTQALALATATDGTLHSSLGLTGGYWYTVAPIVPPGSGDVGVSFAGLNYIISPFATVPVNDPNEGFSGLSVDVFFNSEIGSLGNFGGASSGTKMHFFSNDPAVYKPIPEPASMMLLGMGLFGIAGLRRRKAA